MEVGRYQKDLKFNSNKVKKRKLKQKFDIKKKKKKLLKNLVDLQKILTIITTRLKMLVLSFFFFFLFNVIYV